MKGLFVPGFLVLCLLASGASVSAQAVQGPRAGIPAAAPAARQPVAPVAATVSIDLVAEVNGDKIMRGDLAAECLRLHGEAELNDMVRKTLIQIECHQRKIVIPQEEIKAEIERMARTFGMSSQDWLDLLKNERNIQSSQYTNDIIWPILAIKKLAGPQIKATEAEIRREFDARYGPAVQVRQIMLGSLEEANRIHAEVSANPDSFASVAKNVSLDTASGPYGGLVHPIRRHSVDPVVEQVVFSLKPSQISSVVQFAPQVYMIYRCEQFLQPQDVDIEKVRSQLVMKIEDQKTRKVSEEVFGDLHKRAKIDFVFGNRELMARMPGVAAVVNGYQITTQKLAEHCLDRHGELVLDDMISKLIIEQACKRNNLVITDADIDAEIRQMAMQHLPLLENGQPDIPRWMKMALDENGVSELVYRTNTIWPMLALKRLSRSRVKISEEEVQKSFVSTYGEKVRCLAISFPMTDQRRAMEVWNRANQNRTPEFFGDLAEQYSYDPGSRTSRGVIPPISRFSGLPKLEDEAFSLTPGEISSLIHLDDSLVILYCLGRTEPVATDLESVRTEIMAYLYDLKQQIAVAQYYEELYNQMACDNYLKQQSKNPELERALQQNAPGGQATVPAPGVR